MTNLQVQLDDTVKADADGLFASLGLDTSTAVRIFLSAAIENDGFPFPVAHRSPTAGLRQAIEDARRQENLFGPFDTAEEAVASMLED